MATNEDRMNTIDSILTTTDNDSGIGRTTDESVRAEDSNCSEQVRGSVPRGGPGEGVPVPTIECLASQWLPSRVIVFRNVQIYER